MDYVTGSGSNLISDILKQAFLSVKRGISYVCFHEEKLKKFEKKVESLAERKDRVQRKVDAAQNNGEKIHTDVNSWLIKVNTTIDAEVKEVKDLHDKAKTKCFIGLCPNFKSRYQLSRIAEKKAIAADELFQQGEFAEVSYRDVAEPIVLAPSQDFETFDSRKEVFQGIMTAVKDPNINIIGVYGKPGVGKTSLVKEVIRQVKEDAVFASVVMALVTHTPDIQKIQDEIAEMLGSELKEKSTTGRANRLCERLKKKKKILVVLDDIWERLDLKEVGIPFEDNEHQGCTLLLTSRNANVLKKDMDAKTTFQIRDLKQEEAWELFKKIAGDGVESPDLRPIATEIAKKCGCLPVDIKAMARSLRNGSLSEWKNALQRLSKPSQDFETFDSRKQVFQGIMEAVKDPNINVIGVYGMPGVGKTTLVREVVAQVKQDKLLFNSVVFAAVTHTPDIHKVQLKIAESLGLNFVEQSVTERASRLCQRLKGEAKVLVVLDDLWASLDLTQVGIPSGDEHKGCTILLTSRDENVVSNKMDAQKVFQIGILKQEEAWELFKKMATKSVESLEFQRIAIEIAEKCAGLPIAVSTVAKALRNKQVFAWKDALRQLKNPSSSNFSGVPAEAYSAIELSFNLLESEEHKQTFLLCSLMGHNFWIQDLLKYAMGLRLFHGVTTVEETRNRLLTVVSDLKASCLLLDSYTNWVVDMHDLICDVALSIASKHVFALRHEGVMNDWPDTDAMKSWDKISFDYAQIGKLPALLECPNLSLLYISSKDHSLEMPNSFFQEMKNLRVLDTTGMYFPALPSSISLLANLQTLCLDDCFLGDIARIGELKNLEVLSLLSSDIEMLPKEIGQLIKLKLFDLSDCSKLKRIPSGIFCKLCRLEELYMSNSFVQWEADEHVNQQSNVSLAELMTLSCLTVLEVHIPNAQIIPKHFSFENFQSYYILIGEAWDCERVGDIEYSKTLKLKLQTSIGFLNNGIKVLLKKAENLYLDEMTDLEILVHESGAKDYFQQLKNLHIQNGEMIQHILGGSKFEFPQLQSLTLQNLPNLISFCSGKHGSTSISPQEMALFNQKVVFPKLEKLELSSIGIESIWPSQGFCSTQNLTSLIIEGCPNLKHVLSYSSVEHLKQLKCLEITECKSIQEIISTEEIISENRATISFPLLNSLKLKGLQKLIGFCSADYIVEFQALKILEIENCPNLTGFSHKSTNRDIPTDRVLFDQKVSLSNLEKLTISHLRNVKSIWFNQLHDDSFSNLKDLKVDYCDSLFNIFPPFLPGVLKKLEIVEVTNCDSLEEVFQFQVPRSNVEETCLMTSQLKEVHLSDLPKLKHIWNMEADPNISFGNLREVYLYSCWKLKTLFPFSIARDLHQLKSLTVQSCGVEEIVSKNIKASNEQDIWFEFNQISFLMLWDLPNLMCLYPGNHRTRWPELKEFRTYGCPKMKMIGYGESQTQQPLFPVEELTGQLEKVTFKSDDIAMISESQLPIESLCHIKFVEITESDIFPFSFLQRFGNLEILEIFDSNFKELSLSEDEKTDVIGTRPKLKKLTLYYCNRIQYLWNQESPLDHICATLETLEVFGCGSLINLSSASSSFQNLTTLDVWNCKEMAELITSKKAKNMERLVSLKIRECEMIREVIASEGDEAPYDDQIVFRELKCLELHCLQNLKSFCSGNHTFKFPSLEDVILSQCPRLQNFCPRELSTPKLEKVQLTETDYKGRWAGDLNATVEELYKEQVGYLGLKHLKLSEFPVLIEIWSRNPQEILDFKILEFIEVCDSNNLSCIFNLSMTFSLGRLQRMKIKRCGNLEQVIREENLITAAEEATTSSNIINIFPRLKSIIVESCPDMKSFYLGSSALEFPSLTDLKVADCPNMTNVVSTFLRDEHQEAITGDEADPIAAFFCNKVVFPKLEKISVSHLRKVKSIWCNQLHVDSFSNLKDLNIEGCDTLLYIFPPSFMIGIQRLEILKVTDCASLEEVFQLQVQGSEVEERNVVANQLRELNLTSLPNLKHLWNKDPNGSILVENLRKVYVWECRSLKSLFPVSIARDLQQLESLTVFNCGMEEIVSRNVEGSEEQEIRFEFNKLSFLMLWVLPNLVCFYPGMHRTIWPELKRLRTYDCGNVKMFGHRESQIPQPLFLVDKIIPQLEEVSLSSDDIELISDGQFAIDLFSGIKVLLVTSYLNESAVFPFHFLQRFSNLEELEVVSCNFKDLSHYKGEVGEERSVTIMLPRINKLKLQRVYKIKQLWKQGSPLDHICANLKTLAVHECENLINLSLASSSFQNLTTLDVWQCKEMVELITSSKAQSLERLVTFRIRECEMLREVIASDGDEATNHEIVFRELKLLELQCLQSLEIFCSGNYILKFPSLDQVIVTQCPTLKNFCHEALSTPKLQKLQLTETDTEGRWAGDLNATVEQLYREQNVVSEEKHEDSV